VKKNGSFQGNVHTCEDGNPLLKWDGICTDSFFSAVVIRYVQENVYDDRVICGTMIV
jgi:hypothetical protein